MIQMGLMSKIANSKLGKAGALATGAVAAFVPTYEMLNPPAIYAQANYDEARARKLVDNLANLPEQRLAKGDPVMNDYYKRRAAEILINAFASELKHSSTTETLPGGYVRSEREGVVKPSDICVALNILYKITQDKFGDAFAATAQQNSGIGKLVQMYQGCK